MAKMTFDKASLELLGADNAGPTAVDSISAEMQRLARMVCEPGRGGAGTKATVTLEIQVRCTGSETVIFTYKQKSKEPAMPARDGMGCLMDEKGQFVTRETRQEPLLDNVKPIKAGGEK